ncbi:hypothetical protein C5167_042767 [Papaver somniferum]|uniref:MULE transposase domain-containing protein n=1 Tax=Papaver somniferum TaxID=3469 RepID=A0A4Y7L7D4_PAPSO|nr:hypothetical protein C5167_042767 [Papaver somniferum]
MLMPKTVVAEFKFCNQTVSHPVSGSTTVKDMISVVKQNSQGIDLLKFEIQLRTCIDFISSSSSSAPDPASSSSSSCISSDEVVVVEDITDNACLIKKVPKKSGAWVNILTGVGQLFEGGIDEVKDSVTKYEICSGRKYKLVKSDLAYHGLQFTKRFLWSDDIKSYLDFVWYKDAIEQYNLGSVVNFEYDSMTRWFQKFKGGLMVACGKIGNQEIYPVAFGIVPSENRESWQWFLTNLKGIIREDRPLAIISDHRIGLLKHVPEVFLNAYHSYCLYHIKGNIPIPKGKSRQTAVKLFEECYTVLTKENFYAAAKSMSNLKLDSVVAWMMKISFENWDAHAFLGERRGDNTSNIAESLITLLSIGMLMHFQHLLVDVIRAKVMKHNYKRLLESNKCITRLTPRMRARFNKRITDCRSYKTCICKWWKKHSFPYISPYYTSYYYRGLYSRPIYPIPDSEKPPGINQKGYVLPPNGGREQGGRPKGVRFRDSREKVCKKRKCVQCGMLTFHNRRTCRRAPLAPRAPTFHKESHPRILNFLKRMLF